MSSSRIFQELCTFFLLLSVESNSSLELSYPLLASLGGSCPPRDTCSSLIDPQDDHLWGGRTCECGPHCRTKFTCCIDAVYGAVHSVKSGDLEACRGVAGGFNVLMVDKCPDGDSSPFQEKCEEPSAINQDDPLMSAPVTSKTSGRTYRNYFCALCHQDAEATVVWDISLQGLTREQSDKMTTFDFLEKLVFDPAQGSWGLLVQRNKTRIPKRTQSIPSQNAEVFKSLEGKEISQKSIDDELESNNENGKESPHAENMDVIEFSVTRFNQKPQHTVIISHQIVDIVPSYSTLFGFHLNNRRDGYEKGVSNSNFKTKELNTQPSSRLEVSYKPRGLLQRYGAMELKPLFEVVKEPFLIVSNQKLQFQTENKDAHQQKASLNENTKFSAYERQQASSVTEFLEDSAPTRKEKDQHERFTIIQEPVSEPVSFVPNNGQSKTYESGSQEFIPVPMVNGPFERHQIVDSRVIDQYTEARPQTDTSEEEPPLTIEGNNRDDESMFPPSAPTFQKLSIKFSVPVSLRKIVTKCFPSMVHSCPDDYNTDQYIASACASYYAPVRLRVAGTARHVKFRNVHCGLCNNGTQGNDICVLEQAPRKKSKFSFAMLLDVNGEEERGGHRCEKGQVFDPFSKKCRTLKCGRPGFVVKDKKCVKA